VIANALTEPAVGPLLGLSLLAALVAPALPSAGAALAWLAGWAAAWIAFSARLVAGLPLAQTSSAPVLLIAALAAVVAGLVTRLPRWRRRGAIAVLGAVAVVAGTAWWSRATPIAWSPPGGLRITFLNVGQGDSELLEVPQGAVLVDTGPPDADVACQLRRLGIHSLSAVVLTHPHRDHVGGAPSVMSKIHVSELLDPRQPSPGADEQAAVASAHDAAVPVVAARAGQVLRLGALVIRVLWPDGGGLRNENPHDHAVVLLASFGQTDALFTADAESNVTSKLSLPPVEILKVAHHGSADPGLPDLLRRLRPRIAVIEVGLHNDYGHPRPQTLAALAASPGLHLYRTDLNGRVVVESDGRALTVQAQHGVGSGE